jgi:16S rRNA (cytidine1402-2'-O)-methyltransferase
LDTLADIQSTWGPQTRIAIARELTKMHEEFLRGTVDEVRSELASRDRIRGEFTLLIESSQQSRSASAAESSHEKLSARVARLQTEAGIDEKEALKRLARELGQSKSDLYRELQRERGRRI